MIPKADANFVCAMEQVLDVYERPYNALYPVINLDESPKQLLGQVYPPFQSSDGTLHQDYEYRRHGTVSLYMIVEALAGYREVLVRQRHDARTYAEVIAHIAERYANARRITLVEDNLSAHRLAALYEVMPAEQARALIRRFEVVRTPKHGSWLNIAECELSVLTRYGLKARMATPQEVEQSVQAWYEGRNQAGKGVNWQFTTQDARIKLQHLYPKFQT